MVRALLEAVSQRDLDGVRAVVTDDYVFVTPAGETTLDELATEGFPKHVSPTFEILDHAEDGDEVRVRLRVTMTWDEAGEAASTTEQHGRFQLDGGKVRRGEIRRATGEL